MVVRRRAASEKQAVYLGGDLGAALLNNPTSRQFLSTFNTVNVPVCWRDIEANEGQSDWTIPDTQIAWARKNGLTVSVGPLLVLARRVG